MKRIIIVVIVIVVLGGGYFLFTSLQGGDGSGDGAMMDSGITVNKLLTKGDSVECTLSQEDENGKQTGVMYLDPSNKRMRGNYKTEQSTGEVWDVFVVLDSDWLYFWGGPLPEGTGTKIQSSYEEATEQSDGEEATKPFDLDASADLDCSPWNVDANMFVLPDDVVFQDTRDAAMQAEALGDDLEKIQCDACNQAPDDASIEACRQALGC